jgi:hypothetical protein
MSESFATALKVTGSLRPEATYTTYTRLSEGPESVYVEVLTRDVTNPSNVPLCQLVNQTIDLYVPNYSTLNFSGYGTPAPNTAVGAIASTVADTGAALPSGLVAIDGSPLTLVRGKDNGGRIQGLSGADKAGHKYQLDLKTLKFVARGRTDDKATWVGSKATFTVTQGTPIVKSTPIVTGINFCPSDLLVSLYYMYNDITSLIQIDLSGEGTTRAVRRSVIYAKQSFSSDVLNVPVTETDPGLYLAVAPVRSFFYPVEYLSPGLSYVRGDLPKPALGPSQSPLAAMVSLAALESQPGPQFVTQATGIASSALAPLAASFATPGTLGAADIAFWVGSNLTDGAGRQLLEEAFTSDYTDYKAWVIAQGASGPRIPRKLPQVQYPSPEQVPSQLGVDD